MAAKKKWFMNKAKLSEKELVRICVAGFMILSIIAFIMVMWLHFKWKFDNKNAIIAESLLGVILVGGAVVLILTAKKIRVTNKPELPNPKWTWVYVGTFVFLGVAAFIVIMQLIFGGKYNKDNVSAAVSLLGVITLGGAAALQYRKHRIAEIQARLDQDIKISERLSKAMSQLYNKDELAERSGALYEMRRIATDPNGDYTDMVEILSYHVRSGIEKLSKETLEEGEERLRPERDVFLAAENLTKLYNDYENGSGEYRAQLYGITSKNVDLNGISLIHATLTNARLEGAYLIRAHLEGADLIEAHLEGAYLRGANLERACLIWAHLERAYLGGVNLEGVDFSGAHLKGACLIGAHLEGADLRGVNLEGAYFSGEYLEGYDLSGAHLKGADLSGANLEVADLRGVNLKGAYLSDAHLELANLGGAHLEGADLRKVDFGKFEVIFLADIYINKDTIFDPGIREKFINAHYIE
jgi:uncharacterized protein YjbI with pentapeptide repeats